MDFLVGADVLTHVGKPKLIIGRKELTSNLALLRKEIQFRTVTV